MTGHATRRSRYLTGQEINGRRPIGGRRRIGEGSRPARTRRQVLRRHRRSLHRGVARRAEVVTRDGRAHRGATNARRNPMATGETGFDDLTLDLISMQYHSLRAGHDYGQYIRDAQNAARTRSRPSSNERWPRTPSAPAGATSSSADSVAAPTTPASRRAGRPVPGRGPESSAASPDRESESGLRPSCLRRRPTGASARRSVSDSGRRESHRPVGRNGLRGRNMAEDQRGRSRFRGAWSCAPPGCRPCGSEERA